VIAHGAQVRETAGTEVVEDENGISSGKEIFDEVAPDEAGTARDE
jgi:hypothetical protein